MTQWPTSAIDKMMPLKAFGMLTLNKIVRRGLVAFDL